MAMASSDKRGARRSLAKDLCNEQAYSPRLFTKKQLLLLQQQQIQQQQQQRQYQFADDHPPKHLNLLNSRRIYPSCRNPHPLLLRHAAAAASDISSDCSSHGSPLLPRSTAARVPKKIVVDEKQLAIKLLRARALACSSSSSSSSSSENPSLRASADADIHRSTADFAHHRSLAADLAHRSYSFLGSKIRVRESDAAASGDEKKVACVVGRRSSDAAETRAPVPMLLRSASCSSAASSGLNKLVRLKAADMAPGMQQHAFFCTNEVLDAMDKLHCKRVAWVLKKEFDKAYGPAWHCVVGTSFGSYVTHSVGGFLYFSIGKVSVLLFQTAVELIEHH